MNRKTREELNSLSKQVFGTSSRWQKIVNQGSIDVLEKENNAVVPNLDGSFETKTFKKYKSVVRRYTVEEVKTLMADILKDRSARVPSPSAVNEEVAGVPNET